MDELKERILRGVKNSRFAHSVSSSEIQGHFSQDELDKWTSDNALVYRVIGNEFIFAISPSLSAIKAINKGFIEGLGQAGIR